MYIGQEKKIEKESAQEVSIEKEEAEIEEAWEDQSERKEEREIVNPASVIYKWRALEHEIQEKDKKWYLVTGLILAAIILYAIFTDGLIMAITFILIGVVGYIVLNKKPREINFYITDDGVVADREIYEFEEVTSFWIFYEINGMKVISLHTKNKFMPFVHIPLGKEDPVKIREILLNYLEEIKQKPNIIDNFERMLGI